MRADNSHHLATAARARREQTLNRARTAIQQLQEAGQPITITTVAATAKVSRAWLYAETELREEIARLHEQPRDAPHPKPPAERASDTSLRQRLTLAHELIRELRQDNHQLREQVAQLHGQIRQMKLNPPFDSDSVHDTDTLVRAEGKFDDPR